MATAKKVTEDNHLPGTGDGRFPVYSKQFNKLVDVISELEPSDGTLSADVISEVTAATGVTIDGVLLKDGYIVDSQGTANTGVTAVTYGGGKDFVTVLTVAVTNAVDVADNAALADGYLLYTFPAGPIAVLAASMSMALTLAEDTTATADIGLGTVIASGAVSVLGGTATFENILTGQTAANASGTPTVKTVVNQHLAIEAAGAHTVHLNIADTWADTAGADLTGDIAGTVVIKWSLLA
jgi:hypothetical protein